MTRRREAHIQFHTRDAERDLPRAWVAKAACAKGDIDLVRFSFDKAMIEGAVGLIVEVDCDRPASSLGGSGSKDPKAARRCCASWT